MNGSVTNGKMEVWLGLDVARWPDGGGVIEAVGVDIPMSESAAE